MPGDRAGGEGREPRRQEDRRDRPVRSDPTAPARPPATDEGGTTPADPGLELVPLERVPDREVLELLSRCLGPAAVERSPAFWTWKHQAGPFGPSPGLVAVADGRPVAVRVFLRWRWRTGDRTFDAVRAVDTATHPEWRRRGLFRRLTTALLERVEGEGAAFVFNTPNPTSRAGYLALGWRDVGGAMGRVPVMLRPLRPGRLVAAALGRSRGPEGPEGTGTGDAGAPELPGLAPVAELLEDPALPSFLDAWGQGWGEGGARLHTPRTVGYLRWRYAAVPGIPYRAAWHLEAPPSPTTPPRGAVAIVRPRRRRGLAEAALVELLLSPDRTGRRAARRVIGRIAAIPGLDHLAAVASPGTAERRVLVGTGFLPLPLGPRWTVRPLAGGPVGLHRQRSWRVSAGDLELF